MPDLALGYADTGAGGTVPDPLPPLFAGIDTAILKSLLADCAEQSFAPGEAILTPGQKNQSIHILLSGSLKIYLDEKDTAFTDIKPGECFGEMSIIDRKPVSAYVVALTTSRTLSIHEEKFWRLVGSAPLVARNLLSMLSERIRTRDRTSLLRMHERLALEKELKIARAIQASLLTTKFADLSRQGVDIFALMDPVKEVGGDFYDAFFITPTRLFFCVGDVVGKGMPAALFMVRSITQLRMEAMRDPDPGKILERVNQGLCENNASEMFVTLFCGVLDTATGELVYANAGHNPPLSGAENGAFEFIPMPDGTLVGLFEDARYDNARLSLRPGQSLVAYTDGVTEAMSRSGEFFGGERLRTAINGNGGADAKTLIAAIRAEVYAFTDDIHPADDVTLLALRFLATPDGPAI